MMNDLIDNKLLKENFRNKNYIYCINTLQNEIKQKLIARVRIFKPEYKYCNLADLKTNCYRYLNDKEKLKKEFLTSPEWIGFDKEKLYVTLLCRYSEEEYPPNT